MLAFALFGAAAPSHQARRHPWTIPGTLRIGIIGDPSSLNPLLATTSFEYALAGLCFDGLVAVDDAGHVTPDLATEVPSLRNGGVSPDGKTITYRLRRNVRWHDGARFTSADVVFTWRAIVSPQNNVSVRAGYDQVQSVEAPDDYTVVFHLKRPFAPAIAELMGRAVVVPAHALARFASINRADFNYAPVGTGPFKFVRWLRGDSVEYVANNDYHLGKPRLQRIVVKIVPSVSTMQTELRAHDIDWYDNAEASVFLDARRNPDLRALSMKQNVVMLLILNVTHRPLDDAGVRRAIAAAIDRQSLLIHSGLPATLAACGDVPPDSWAYDAALRCPYDPERAARELGGRRLSLTLAYIVGSDAERTALLLQQMLAQVGVEVRLHGYPPPAFLAPGVHGVVMGGHFDMALVSIGLDGDPDDSLLLTCRNRAPSGFDLSRYCSEEMDALQAASLATFDRGRRKAIIAKIENLIVRDVPDVCLWFIPDLAVMNPDLKGVVDASGYMSDLPYEWSI